MATAKDFAIATIGAPGVHLAMQTIVTGQGFWLPGCGEFCSGQQDMSEAMAA